jgi:two-component system OmpR family response regulator
MNKQTIFIVEDNKELQHIISLCLAEDDYLVVTADNAQECFEKLKKNSVDLILLDILLPDGNGLALIQRIRQITDAPIIAISGKNEMADKVVGLEMGADDYITKPFEAPELKARVRAHLRRYANFKEPSVKDQSNIQAEIAIGKWTLNRSRFQIFDENGKSGNLTVGEFRLLELLAASPNRVLSREQILDVIKNENLDILDRAIDIQIARVRKKIGDNGKSPEIIKTVRSIGYMLVLDKN